MLEYTKLITFQYGPYTFEVLVNDDADDEQVVALRKAQIDLDFDNYGDYTHSDLYVDDVDYQKVSEKIIENQNGDNHNQ